METEATAARAALARLDVGLVDEALRRAAGLLRERRGVVLDANRTDFAEGSSRLDAGALDRLRLDEGRVEATAAGLEATAELPPLERVVRAWRLPNGLEVSERRVPIGVVGANFEARPNVAADVASQVLKAGTRSSFVPAAQRWRRSPRSSTRCFGLRWSRPGCRVK